MGISNNIIHGIVSESSNSSSELHGIWLGGNNASSMHWVYNNTIYDIKATSAGTGSTAEGMTHRASQVSTIRTRNNFVGDIDSVADSEDDYSNISGSEADYNVSSDATASGANSVTGQTSYSSYFVSVTGTYNLHLKNESSVGSIWGQAGTDLRSDPDLAVTDDIDGDARIDTTPDIGADEFTGSSILRGAIIIVD